MNTYRVRFSHPIDPKGSQELTIQADAFQEFGDWIHFGIAGEDGARREIARFSKLSVVGVETIGSPQQEFKTG